jgi:hypothetical protein
MILKYIMLIKIREIQASHCGSHLNPSYSGDRDQEDRGLKTAWANSLQDPKDHHKREVVEWVKV